MIHCMVSSFLSQCLRSLSYSVLTVLAVLVLSHSAHHVVSFSLCETRRLSLGKTPSSPVDSNSARSSHLVIFSLAFLMDSFRSYTSAVFVSEFSTSAYLTKGKAVIFQRYIQLMCEDVE